MQGTDVVGPGAVTEDPLTTVVSRRQVGELNRERSTAIRDVVGEVHVRLRADKDVVHFSYRIHTTGVRRDDKCYRIGSGIVINMRREFCSGGIAITEIPKELRGWLGCSIGKIYRQRRTPVRWISGSCNNLKACQIKFEFESGHITVIGIIVLPDGSSRNRK